MRSRLPSNISQMLLCLCCALETLRRCFMPVLLGLYICFCFSLPECKLLC